jgi:hypothetical protein
MIKNKGETVFEGRNSINEDYLIPHKPYTPANTTRKHIPSLTLEFSKHQVGPLMLKTYLY